MYLALGLLLSGLTSWSWKLEEATEGSDSSLRLAVKLGLGLVRWSGG